MRNVLNIALFALVFASSAFAQSGGPYEIVSYTIDGGGIVNASGGNYTMSGTVGQPDAGAVMSGGAYELAGGFWPTVVGPACPADFTGEGVLDIFDVFTFLDAYALMDPAADFAAPFGTFDIFDVFAFLDVYSMGCP